MSFIGRLFERFNIKEQKGVIVAPTIWRYTGEPKKVSLEELEHFYRSDADVRSAIDTLAEMVAGVGYYTSAESEEAKRLVDDFAEKVNLDALLVDVVRNMLLFGDAYVERIFDGRILVDLLLLPSKTVSVVRDIHGRVEKYIQQTFGHRVEFKPEEIVQFSYLKIGNSTYGVSLLEPILPILRQKEKSIEAMGKILERYASPRVIWKVPTARDAKTLADMLSSLEPGQDPIISGDIEFQPLTVDPRVNFQFFYEYLDKQIFEALKAPSLAWFRNATEASAKVMLDIVERHIAGIQRYIKRKVEGEIFKPLVEAYGISEVPRLNWGLPRTKLDEIGIDDIAKLVQTMTITPSQAQKWLIRMGFPIEEASEALKEQFFRARWMEDIDEVYLLLNDPSDADPTSIRYVTVDSERGVYMVVAYSKSARVRMVFKIGFKKANGWTVDKARDWYESNFPRVFEVLKNEDSKENRECV